jgi:glycosyltransferase involved in cell wall biosynthesis
MASNNITESGLPALSTEQGNSQHCRAATESMRSMRIAVVHEWLATYSGSEQVLAQILAVYPQADLFAVVDFLPADQRAFLANRSVSVSFIQHLPLARRKFRWYLPLMPLAIEQLDLSDYDLVISSSHAVSKGVLTKSHQLHISYVHTPIRYAWDLQGAYLGRTSGIGLPKSILARLLMHYLRIWDLRTSAGVDYFIANSQAVARRIMRTYRRPAAVLYPPVDINSFRLAERKDDFYATVARLVPYKRVDLLLEAFARMPQHQLLVIGTGPELARLRRNAPPNVHFKGRLSGAEMRACLEQAKAFVFAGEEDFGISMVEAQACGTPVLAFARGGAAEIVREGETGLLFDRQTPEAIVSAVSEFEQRSSFDPVRIRLNALRFDVGRFREGLRGLVDDAIRNQWTPGLGPQPYLDSREPSAIPENGDGVDRSRLVVGARSA